MTDAAITIADARSDDADAVAALHCASWLASYRGVLTDDYLDNVMTEEKRVYWRDRLSSPGEEDLILCAWSDGRLAGFAAGWRDPALFDGAYLYSLHAAPDVRGRGVGRRLMAAFARRMRAAGIEQLWLHVFSGNRRAIRFYNRLGGRRGLTARTTDYGGVTRDLTYLWDDLDALIARAEAPIQQPGPVAVAAATVDEIVGAAHPVDSAAKAQGRRKQRLGDVFGLDQYGVNRVVIPPGDWSTVRHWHTHEDEFVYVLSGVLTLITDRGETRLRPGDCAGFKAGVVDGHRLENRGDEPAVYLEIGSRRPDVDETHYSEEDLMVGHDAEGRQVFMRRDGAVVKAAD